MHKKREKLWAIVSPRESRPQSFVESERGGRHVKWQSTILQSVCSRAWQLEAQRARGRLGWREDRRAQGQPWRQVRPAASMQLAHSNSEPTKLLIGRHGVALYLVTRQRASVVHCVAQ